MTKTPTAVRIKDRDLEALKQLAKEEDETVSYFIQKAIREFLNRNSKLAGRKP